MVRRKSTSRHASGHEICPWLLGNFRVERPNKVRALDVTYAPICPGFVYFVAVT
jgi:putative transposase